MSSQNAPVCPRCGKLDAVQKVSSLFAQGVTTVEYSPPGAIVGTSTASSMTLLAERLKPPKQPEGGKLTAGAFIFWSVVGGLIGALLFREEAGVTIGFVVGILFAGLLAARADEKRKRAYPAWQKAIQKWNSLYYCGRDDGIFIPNEERFVPVEQIQAFLYE